MKVEFHELFPVLIATYQEVLNKEQLTKISKYLLSRTDVAAHPVFTEPALSQHSFNGQNTNILHNISREVEGCADLQNLINKCTNEYALAHNLHECNIFNSWYNVQQLGSSVQRHSHISVRNPSTVSGALYINVGDDSSEIIFENPNQFTHLYAPKDPTASVRYICKSMSQAPLAGTMIIFPAWLIHSVTPSRIDNRIVISFNAG